MKNHMAMFLILVAKSALSQCRGLVYTVWTTPIHSQQSRSAFTVPHKSVAKKWRARLGEQTKTKPAMLVFEGLHVLKI